MRTRHTTNVLEISDDNDVSLFKELLINQTISIWDTIQQYIL